jgi:hypothetical protein
METVAHPCQGIAGQFSDQARPRYSKPNVRPLTSNPDAIVGALYSGKPNEGKQQAGVGFQKEL